MQTAVGLVFEVATLVGVTLFESDSQALSAHIARTHETIALLPERIHTKPKSVDDDF